MGVLLPTAGAETESPYVPDDLLAGSADIVTNGNETLLTGQNLAARTVVGRVTASGKLIKSVQTATDGSEKPVGILVYAVDATSADKKCSIYTGGAFNPDALVWDATYNTDAKKWAAFDRTNITLRRPGYSG